MISGRLRLNFVDAQDGDDGPASLYIAAQIFFTFCASR